MCEILQNVLRRPCVSYLQFLKMSDLLKLGRNPIKTAFEINLVKDTVHYNSIMWNPGISLVSIPIEI